MLTCPNINLDGERWNKDIYDFCPECMEKLYGFITTVEREEKA